MRGLVRGTSENYVQGRHLAQGRQVRASAGKGGKAALSLPEAAEAECVLCGQCSRPKPSPGWQAAAWRGPSASASREALWQAAADPAAPPPELGPAPPLAAALIRTRRRGSGQRASPGRTCRRGGPRCAATAARCLEDKNFEACAYHHPQLHGRPRHREAGVCTRCRQAHPRSYG